MTGRRKNIASIGGLVATACSILLASSALASDEKSYGESKPAGVQNASYNGLTCDHVRAKVAESGVVAAYAYARYMGMTSRDIAKVRKACSV